MKNLKDILNEGFFSNIGLNNEVYARKLKDEFTHAFTEAIHQKKDIKKDLHAILNARKSDGIDFAVLIKIPEGREFGTTHDFI